MLSLALMLTFLLPVSVGGQSTIRREYPIKAAFLFNFAKFVEWPPEAFKTESTPFVIGVLGNDPFDQAIDDIVRGEVIRNRPLAVRRSRDVAELKDCQMLFVSRSERNRVKEILEAVKSLPILTVSDIEGFAGQGGVIGFYNESSKVRFEINPNAAGRQGVKISSELIRIARTVGDERE